MIRRRFWTVSPPEGIKAMMSDATAVVVLSLGVLFQPVLAALPCNSTSECAKALLEGSECVDGYCSNPFYSNGGCLRSMLPNGFHKIRTCGSDDPPSAAALGYCRPTPYDYMEIRIACDNWDSAIFNSWVVQIVLSEMLDVPVSLETYAPDLNMDFYNPDNTYGYGAGNTIEFIGMVESARIGDCRLAERKNGSAYKPCLHLDPEVWLEDIVAISLEKQREGVMESSLDLGMMASERWFVPRHTAAAYPSVVSYLGIAGDDKREFLADIFKRPTTWTQYCAEVSPNHCSNDDGVAVRPPKTEEEGDHYFVPGLYEGYFRATAENDCQANPHNCTGHLADYPCGWSSYVKQQAYHLNIAMKSSGPEASDGYESRHLREIWAAANATKSHVAMMWWWPEPMFQDYVGTDYEFTAIELPQPTQECLENRVAWYERCSEDFAKETGDAEGACDTSPQVLAKLIGANLRELTKPDSKPEALWSPAVETITSYRMTSLQMGQIFTAWRTRGIDPDGFDPRYAVCQWVVDNFEILQSYVPDGYPRVVEEHNPTDSALFETALAVSAAAIVLICFFFYCIFAKRRKRIMFYVRLPFICTFLTGLGMIGIGAMLMAVPPSDVTCILAAWFVNLGYATELAPLAIKIDAIHRLSVSGAQMRRVRLSNEHIFGAVVISCAWIGSILLLWTLLDPPREGVTYRLTEEVTSRNETVVLAATHCASDSLLWHAVCIGTQGLFLLYSLVLVFMAKRSREDMNDTRNHALLVFAQVVFLALRIAIVAMSYSIDPTVIAGITSIFLGADCIFTSLIMVLPKLLEKSDDQLTDEIVPDLFLHTTILIADIGGFTAWSSVRDPTQVFKFLDTVYAEFDRIAQKREVFKVETVRDCYVAATGVPTARREHASLMARFAVDITIKMKRMAQELEIVYGPDTCELSLKVGLNSGPVTGGYMKGKGARFQLLGDTMTMAVNLERAGQRGRIHVSERTAALLINSGKGHWLVERKPPAHIKGKGEIKTYWLAHFEKVKEDRSKRKLSDGSIDEEDAMDRALWSISNDEEATKLNRTQRLVDWNIEVMQKLLKEIVARRDAGFAKEASFRPSDLNGALDLSETTDTHGTGYFESNALKLPWKLTQSAPSEATEDSSAVALESTMPLEEVQEIIHLPDFDGRVDKRMKDEDDIEIPEPVLEQLRYLVQTLSAMYNNDNSFHNFNHACHVVQAVIKMMNRIVAAADLDLGEDADRKKTKVAEALHDHTYGITSDPLTRFACVFSALIHDLDHPGVPNPQLIKENPAMAAHYQSRSVAEQNSFDLAWNLLMDKRFYDLRRTICRSKKEFVRFRQLVVNSVMATDLGDKELKALRNGRWEKAFSAVQESAVQEPESEAVNRKATIVIEHIIQAADVSHTMQHWHVYREWNENLFREMYYAYKAGRAGKNPAEFWYNGEIGFFDFYIIPLSKKLADCGVFGVTSDENLNYAMSNRAEWLAKGKEVVAEMVEKLRLEELEKVESKRHLEEEKKTDSFPDPDQVPGQISAQGSKVNLGDVVQA